MVESDDDTQTAWLCSCSNRQGDWRDPLGDENAIKLGVMSYFQELYGIFFNQGVTPVTLVTLERQTGQH